MPASGNSYALLTRSGFPAPNPVRSHEEQVYNSPPHANILSASSSHRAQQVSSPPRILKYLRTLRQITGTITDRHVLQAHDEASVPAGISPAVDTYLQAWGYDSTAKLQIAYAYNSSNDVDIFVNEICGYGMAKSEAEWLFRYIAFNDTRP